MTFGSSLGVRSIGLSTVRGLPAHILIVHAVVVFVPLAGVALVAALRPHLARRLGAFLPGVAIVALLSVLAAMNAGGWLQNHVQNTQLVHDHTEMAGQLWPFSAAVGLLSLFIWWQQRTADDAQRTDEIAAHPQGGGLMVRVVVGVLAVLMAAGSIVEVARIGESGARASWNGHFSQTSSHRG